MHSRRLRRSAASPDELQHLLVEPPLGGGLKDAGWMRENMSKNRLAIIPNQTHSAKNWSDQVEGAPRG
jgi:hypothetical protein